jgi:hypothetical protein
MLSLKGDEVRAPDFTLKNSARQDRNHMESNLDQFEFNYLVHSHKSVARISSRYLIERIAVDAVNTFCEKLETLNSLEVESQFYSCGSRPSAAILLTLPHALGTL